MMSQREFVHFHVGSRWTKNKFDRKFMCRNIKWENGALWIVVENITHGPYVISPKPFLRPKNAINLVLETIFLNNTIIENWENLIICYFKQWAPVAQRAQMAPEGYWADMEQTWSLWRSLCISDIHSAATMGTTVTGLRPIRCPP